MKRENWGNTFPAIRRAEILDFIDRTGDTNPIHRDAEAARKIGLREIIAPGVMTLGYVSSAIGNEISLAMVHELAVKFKSPLYPGTVPTVLCTVSQQRRISADVNFEVFCGLDLIATGSCGLLLPR